MSRVEHRRREDGGAESIRRDEGCPLPSGGRGLRTGMCPLPKIFRSLSSKRRVLVHSGTDKIYSSSAWRLDFFGQQPSGVLPPQPPVDSALVLTGIDIG